VLVFVPANVWRSFITCPIVDVKRQPTSSGVNDFFWKKTSFQNRWEFSWCYMMIDLIYNKMMIMYLEHAK
jgi:hypothetical protein